MRSRASARTERWCASRRSRTTCRSPRRRGAARGRRDARVGGRRSGEQANERRGTCRPIGRQLLECLHRRVGDVRPRCEADRRAVDHGNRSRRLRLRALRPDCAQALHEHRHAVALLQQVRLLHLLQMLREIGFAFRAQQRRHGDDHRRRMHGSIRVDAHSRPLFLRRRLSVRVHGRKHDCALQSRKQRPSISARTRTLHRQASSPILPARTRRRFRSPDVSVGRVLAATLRAMDREGAPVWRVGACNRWHVMIPPTQTIA